MPPTPASAPPMSNLERCIAQAWCTCITSQRLSCSLTCWLSRVFCPRLRFFVLTSSPRLRGSQTVTEKNAFFFFFLLFHRCCCETRTKESKHVCDFLGSLTRLSPTAMGGELCFASEGTGVSMGGRARSSPLFFCGADIGVHEVCTSFFSFGNIWICARRTNDRDSDMQR